VHAYLDAPGGPLTSSTPPTAIVAGFGFNGDCAQRDRRVGTMDIARVGTAWHSYCELPFDCTSQPSLAPTDTCVGPSTTTSSVYVTTYPYARAEWGLYLTRQQHGGVYDGAIIGHGDSGGPALVPLALNGGGAQLYVLGTASASNNGGNCDETPPTLSMSAMFSATFSPDNGDWIETVLRTWLDVPPPATPYTPPNCTRDWLTGALHCSKLKTVHSVE
jgi:hypothetical protein